MLIYSISLGLLYFFFLFHYILLLVVFGFVLHVHLTPPQCWELPLYNHTHIRTIHSHSTFNAFLDSLTLNAS